MFFKSFKRKKTENKRHVDNTSIYYGSTKKSIQCLGMDFLLNHNFAFITNKKEQWYEDDFACISAIVNGRPALVFSISVMYPDNYEKNAKDKSVDFLEIAKEFNTKGDLDLYLIGIGAINKNENRKSVFQAGDRYSIALGSIILLKPSDDAKFGLICENPLVLSSMDEEYWVVSKLKAKHGEIIGYERIGSVISPVSEKIIDKRIFKVLVDDAIQLKAEYPIFIDCYSKLSVGDDSPIQLAFFDLIK